MNHSQGQLTVIAGGAAIASCSLVEKVGSRVNRERVD